MQRTLARIDREMRSGSPTGSLAGLDLEDAMDYDPGMNLDNTLTMDRSDLIETLTGMVRRFDHPNPRPSHRYDAP